MDVFKAVVLRAVDEKVGVACRNLEKKGKKKRKRKFYSEIGKKKKDQFTNTEKLKTSEQ